MAYVITTIFAYLIEMIGAIFLFSNIYMPKKKIPLIVLCGVLIYSVPTVLFLTVNNLYLNFLTFFLANFFFAILLYESTWVSALVLSMVLEAGMIGSEFLVMSILTSVFGAELNEYKSTNYMYFLIAFINKIVYFFICQIISQFKIFHKDKRSAKNVQSKTPLFLLVYPFCTILVCILFWLMSYEHTFSIEINIYIVAVCVFFLLSILATYLLYNQTAKKEAEVYVLQSELERKEIDEAYYKVLDYQNEELKTLVHDEKSHLSVIKSLSNVDEIEKYVDKIYDDLNKYSSSGKTKNKMLDLILNKYKVLCEKDDIDFYVNIRTANLSFMENTDLTTMLSNILDNAIEAAKNSKEKKIDLSINRVNGGDMFTCINSSDVKPVSVAGVLKTTKEDKKFHGAGTKSIKRMVNKYKGEYEWDYDEEEKEFSTLIMFPANKKE